jgi:flagellar motor switch protein FliM
MIECMLFATFVTILLSILLSSVEVFFRITIPWFIHKRISKKYQALNDAKSEAFEEYEADLKTNTILKDL